MDNELDYEMENLSDEEAKEELDAFVEYIKEQIDYEEEGISVTNLNKLKVLAYTYRALCYLTKGTSAKVTYELNEPFNSMGSVSVVGKNLVFKNPSWVVLAARLASNFNVYPKLNGTVQMDFTFNGLTDTVD